MGGSLKIWQRSGWFFFLMRFHFSIKASFIGDTKGWYCVTTGNINFLFPPCCFVSRGRTSSFCEFYLFLIAIFLSNCVGSLCPSGVL